MTRPPNPIVAEVRTARDAIAREFDYDIGRIARELQARQARSGRPVVRLPPRRPATAEKAG